MPAKATPQFRPRGFHEQSRRSRRRKLLLFGGAGAVVIIAMIVGGLLLITGGSDSNTGAATTGPVSQSTAGSADARKPALQAPASRFIPTLRDLTAGTEAYAPAAYTMKAVAWGSTGPFSSPSDGEKRANELGYIDGYHVSYQPDGQLAGVLQGRWYTTIEIELFGDADKAAQAYSIYETLYRGTAG